MHSPDACTLLTPGLRGAAAKPFACPRLEERLHGCQERNVVRASSERAQPCSPALGGPTTVHAAAPPSVQGCFSGLGQSRAPPPPPPPPRERRSRQRSRTQLCPLEGRRIRATRRPPGTASVCGHTRPRPHMVGNGSQRDVSPSLLALEVALLRLAWSSCDLKSEDTCSRLKSTSDFLDDHWQIISVSSSVTIL